MGTLRDLGYVHPMVLFFQLMNIERERSQVSAEGSTYSFSFRELVKATDLALS